MANRPEKIPPHVQTTAARVREQLGELPAKDRALVLAAVMCADKDTAAEFSALMAAAELLATFEELAPILGPEIAAAVVLGGPPAAGPGPFNV